MMSVPRFEIVLDNIGARFLPGDIVKGTVLFDITGNKYSRGLLISCRGGAYTKLCEKKVEVEGREKYVTYDHYLKGNGLTQLVFQPGSYAYEFSFTLPVDIPNTISTPYGYIRYIVLCRFYEAAINNHFTEEYLNPDLTKHIKNSTEIEIIILKGLGISHTPGIENSQYKQAFKRVGFPFCSEGDVSFLVSIPRTGFKIGEFINVTADIRNMSSRPVMYSEVGIYQCLKFVADNGYETNIHQLVCSTKKGGIPPKESYLWDSVPILVPKICDINTQYCGIISITYKLRFSVGVKTKFTLKKTKVEIPVILGRA